MQIAPQEFHWQSIPLYILLIVGFFWFTGRIKALMLWIAALKAEKEMQNPAYHTTDSSDTWDARRIMHWTVWRDTIIAQHSSRGVVIGLTVTALAAFIGLVGKEGLTFGEFLILAAASSSILVQTVLSVWESRNEREVAFTYIGDPTGKNKDRVTKSLFDNMLHPAIQLFTLLSLLLVILLITQRAYRAVNGNLEQNTSPSNTQIETQVSATGNS